MMVTSDAEKRQIAKIARTVFGRRLGEWLSELLALGLLPWLAHLIVSGGGATENAWERPELYLFVMVISVTSLFEVTKDRVTINFTKPLAFVTAVVGAVLGPACYARLSNPVPAGERVPPVNQFLESSVLGIIALTLGVYAMYRLPIIWGQAKGEAEAHVAQEKQS